MRRMMLMLALLLLPCMAWAEEAAFMPVPGGETVAEYAGDTLCWRIEETVVGKSHCYVTQVWMADPGTQIGKATADWEKNTLPTADIAERAPQASLIINASGYVTRTYSWIPDNYPGESSDYYFTPLGSVTVTDGQVFRCLEGVPYYGLTLNADGLRMHVGDDPQQVISEHPSQTWSFYVECPVIQDHQSILDPDWRFTNTRAMRTVIAKVDDHHYLILTVTNRKSGMTMADCVAYLMNTYDPIWAYNLDGGPSSALMYRDENGRLRTVWKNGQSNVDIMTFSEGTR